MNLGKNIHGNLRQTAVIPSGGQSIRQQREGAVLGQVLVPPVKHILQHLLHQNLPLPFVTQAKIRVQIQQMPALPEQGGTEGMDGGDLRPIDQGRLAAQVAVVGILCQPVGEFLGDPPPQLRGGGLGKGNDQKPVDIDLLLGHPVQQPLHQHPCFARSGRRRYQQLTAPVVHDFLLFICQREEHGAASFIPSIRSDISQRGCRYSARLRPVP